MRNFSQLKVRNEINFFRVESLCELKSSPAETSCSKIFDEWKYFIGEKIRDGVRGNIYDRGKL